MGRKFTVYGLRFSKTSFWNRINTGFLDPAVATVLTACGIETVTMTQFTSSIVSVATVLTACGIETCPIRLVRLANLLHVATVLTACGIETDMYRYHDFETGREVATVLTACGIETMNCSKDGSYPVTEELQQCLPLAVLKLNVI